MMIVAERDPPTRSKDPAVRYMDQRRRELEDHIEDLYCKIENLKGLEGDLAYSIRALTRVKEAMKMLEETAWPSATQG
jgi:hypothetical protein